MYYGERLNSISHLVGAVLALIGLGALLTILLYTMSTLYHSFHPPHLKKIFKLLDHVAIYLLIAGTYTPFMLVSLRDGNGFLILGIIWALALAGILSELLLSGRAVKAGQLIIYLGMGWACSFDFASLRAELPEMGLWWLTAGGIAYTVGVVFYILDKMNRLNHAHGIWHFFVLAGSVCHFISVLGYVR
jgi:hemolysin III